MKVGVPRDEGNVTHAYAVTERLGADARVKPTWNDAVVYVGPALCHAVMTDLHP